MTDGDSKLTKSQSDEDAFIIICLQWAYILYILLCFTITMSVNPYKQFVKINI